MFKKVRSLLVAGLLVMGMSGSVFADGVEASQVAIPETHTSLEQSVNYTKGLIRGRMNEKLIGAGAEYTQATNTTPDHYIFGREDMMTDASWEVFMDEIEAAKLDGIIIEEVAGDTDEVKEYKVYYDTNFNGTRDEKEGQYIENDVLATIEVNFIDTTEKGIFDIAPGTGDAALAVGGIAVAAVAIGALVYVNKKEDKDEE